VIEPDFVAIGKIPGESIFVHKDDVSLLSNDENTRKIKCIAIDFRSRGTSVPVVIDLIFIQTICFLIFKTKCHSILFLTGFRKMGEKKSTNSSPITKILIVVH